MPRSRASMTNFSTIAAWCTPSAEVGSSRISTFAPKWTARAMATDCRSPPERVPTAWVGSRTWMPTSTSAWRATALACSLSKRRKGKTPVTGSRPRKKFRAMRHHRDHARGPGTPSPRRHRPRRAGCGRRPARRRPGSRPRSAGATPERILISVDLPAPLSPSRQCTSPGLTAIDDVAERDDRAEALGDVAQLDRRDGASSIPTSRRAPWRGRSC